MSVCPDIVLYDKYGQLTAVAEVKNKAGTSSDWAAGLRHNILAHGDMEPVRFFLLVTPDKLYLWRNARPGQADVLPEFELDAQPIFEPYFKRAGVSRDDASSNALELVVASWLSDVIRAADHPDALLEGQDWLTGTGLLDALKNGRIEYEVAK